MSLKFLFVLGHHLVPGVDELVNELGVMVQRIVENGGLDCRPLAFVNNKDLFLLFSGMATKCWKEVPDSCKPIIPDGSCICVYFNAPFCARCVRFPPTWINSSRKGPRACWFPRKYGIHKFVQHSVATKRNRETTYWRRLLERMGRAGLHQVLTTLFDLFALALAKRQCSIGTPVASRNLPFPPISISTWSYNNNY